MAAIIFDTHAFVKELTHAGMPEEQAEVLARSQAALIDEKLATKQDLKEIGIASEARLDPASGFYDGGRDWRGRCSGKAIVRISRDAGSVEWVNAPVS